MLHGAMAFASPAMVKLLLENGANPYITEITGSNSLMAACMCNRLDNVKCWLTEFPDWDLDTRNKFGASALSWYVSSFSLSYSHVLPNSLHIHPYTRTRTVLF